ncbi:hypothetical protein HanIR_Chr04g0201821 [Helianthus annuus]|nr:hypothetical protein HanIR_Chr04g0201821 [Helianthus annuus]
MQLKMWLECWVCNLGVYRHSKSRLHRCNKITLVAAYTRQSHRIMWLNGRDSGQLRFIPVHNACSFSHLISICKNHKVL